MIETIFMVANDRMPLLVSIEGTGVLMGDLFEGDSQINEMDGMGDIQERIMLVNDSAR